MSLILAGIIAAGIGGLLVISKIVTVQAEPVDGRVPSDVKVSGVVDAEQVMLLD